MTDEPKILFIDIETSPNISYHWGLFDQNIGISQVIEPTRMICFAAKWSGSRDVGFWSEWGDGHLDMVFAAYDLLAEADWVVGFNSKNFDIRHLNREFALARRGGPPQPFHQIDLYKAVQKTMYLTSNKLDWVAQYFLGESKIKTDFELWRDVLAGNPKARVDMEKYNIRDVVLTEKVYEFLKPWIPAHPSWSVHTGDFVCPACGSDRLQKRGFTYTQVSKYQQYRCQKCGKYSRGNKRLSGTTITGVVL